MFTKRFLAIIILALFSFPVFAQVFAPSHLNAEVDRLTGEATLNWVAFDQEVMTYTDGTLETGFVPVNGTGIAWAQRFTPQSSLNLLEVSTIAFEGVLEDGTLIGLNDIQFKIFGEGPNTETPGDVLYTSANIAIDNSGAVTHDVSGENLSFDNDFWVAVIFTADNGPFIAFDTDTPHDNRLRVAADPYTTWSVHTYNYSIAISSLIEHSDGTVTVLGNNNTNSVSENIYPVIEAPAMTDVVTSAYKAVCNDHSHSNELDEFIEYNIYRNGVVAGQSNTASFSETLTEAGDAVYTVTAVFDEGESDPTNEASVYWTANIAPPANVRADVDLSNGEVEVSWEMYDWGVAESVISAPTSTDQINGAWNWQNATFCQFIEPDSYCRLLGIRYQFSGSAEFGVRLYNIQTIGPNIWPNEVIFEETVDAELPGWVYVDLQDDFLFFNGPFFAGFHDMHGTASIMYNDCVDGTSYLHSPDDTWGNFNGELSLHIEAVVEYPDGTVNVVGNPSELDELTGFELYRDDVAIANLDATTFSYTDQLPVEGGYEYYLVSTFDEGDSPASNPVNAFWQQSLAANGNFEEWANGEPVGWNVDIGAAATIEPETENVHSGDTAARVTFTTHFPKKLKQQVLADVGEEYTFRAWVYDNDPQGVIRINILFRDENGEGAQGEVEGLDQFNSAPTSDADEWRLLEVTGVAPANTHDVRMYVRFYGSEEFSDQATGLVDNCALFGPAVEIPVATIEEIQTVHNSGDMVRTSGIVTIPEDVYTDEDYVVYIQDNSGYGVQLYDDDLAAGLDVERGDEVIVIGTVHEEADVTSLRSLNMQIASSNNPLPDIYDETPGALNNSSAMEGRWVEVTGARGPIQSDQAGEWVPVSDNSGWVQIRLFENADLSLDGTAEGDEITFRGVITMFFGGVQIAPAFTEDIIPVGSAPEELLGLPGEFAIESAYPNPFNPVSNIKLALPQTADIQVYVYNILGEEVAVLHHGVLDAGYHTLQFDARNQSTGLYFVKFMANGSVRDMRKVMFVK